MTNENIKMKIRICSILLAFVVTIAMAPFVSQPAAAANTTAQNVTAIATACEGKTLYGVKEYFKANNYDMWNSSYEYDWCAWFISNCAVAAHVPESAIGHFTYADNGGFYGWAKDKGIFKKRGTYTPKVGDICFFNWGNGIAHVEYVYKVTKSNVYTVGGNTGNDAWNVSTVKCRSWSKSNSNIAGYAAINYPIVMTSYAAASSGKPVITWTEHPNAVKYKIYYKTESANSYTYLTSRTSGGSLTYDSAKPTYGYYFKVVAVDSKGNTLKSATKYQICKLKKPSINNIYKSNGKIRIEYSGVKSANSYKLYRATSANGKYDLIYTSNNSGKVDKGGESHSMIIGSGTQGKRYYFKIQACHSKYTNGNSSYSNYASIVR